MNPTAQAKVEPGIFSDMSESDYFALPCVSNSRLTPLLKSAAHCLWSMEHPSEPTAAMTLGSAVDCLVFTPTLFGERFAVAEQCFSTTAKNVRCSKDGTARFGKRAGMREWHCSTHQKPLANYLESIGKDEVEVLSPDQSSTAYAMAKAVHDHPGASVLLAACEEFQLSLVWKENTLLCKGRLDGLSSELKTIVDLKTTDDASPDAFSRSIANYGYARQAAMYLRGVTYHGIEIKNYVIIAVESEAPFAVALYTLTERPVRMGWGGPRERSPVEHGNHQLLRLLDLYERCEATGKWDGYPVDPQPISLPKWAEMQIEKE